jgi:integrative and conjugative element protein (TIGR02256 family)
LANQMLAAVQAHGDRETGGMLVGYEGDERPEEVVVTSLIAGGPNASHREYTFRPDGRWQRKELARLYAASGRVMTFIGDWHSHPHGLPLPSPTDLKTAARTAANKRARAPRPLTLIVGRDKEGDWLLAAFRYQRGRMTAARLRIFGADAEDLLLDLEPSRRLRDKSKASSGADL